MKVRAALSSFIYLWFLLLLVLPVWGIASGAFAAGFGAFFAAIAQPEALASIELTLLIAAISVLINTIFGVMTALLIARKSPGSRILNGIVDIPFAVSPVIAGLVLLVIYGPHSFIGGLFAAQNIKLVFAIPGMVLATLFVTFPLVVRELVPVLQEIGTQQEEAALTLGASRWTTLWKITLPSVKWSLLYGSVLTLGRSLGEFGAVLVVSGNITRVTQTSTLYVYQAAVGNQMQAAYAVSIVLAAASFLILLVLELAKRGKFKTQL